jgi:hypothetical protein
MDAIKTTNRRLSSQNMSRAMIPDIIARAGNIFVFHALCPYHCGKAESFWPAFIIKQNLK